MENDTKPAVIAPKTPKTQNTASSIGSSIWSRLMLAYRAGMAFAGRRDYYQTYGYPRALTTSQLLAKYQRQDITSRIVNMPPEEMWKKEIRPTLTGVTASAAEVWEEFVAKSELYDRIIQADKLLYFGPFSILLLGMPGHPSTPAGEIKSLDDILYVQAYGGDAVKVKEYESSPTNPRFGQPLTYEVHIGPADESTGLFSTQTKLYHWTRVIHIVDRPLQGTMFGEPRLNQIYNLLDDLLKVGGGSAELFWNTANRGMQIDVDKEMELDADSAAQLTEELDEYQHNLRRYIRTRGVKISNLGSDTADPRGVFETIVSLLAGATSIPQRILMGAEAGQLASEQDRANWAEYIARRRSSFGEPYVLRPVLRHIGQLKLIKADAWTKGKWVWPDAFPMNPLEKANAMASMGRAIVNLSRRNQFGDPIISDEEARVLVGLPEKIPQGHTMPEMPVKETETGTDAAKGIQSVPGGASDAPSQITKDPGEAASNMARNAAAVAIEAAVAADRAARPPLKRHFRAQRDQNGAITGEVWIAPDSKNHTTQ